MTRNRLIVPVVLLVFIVATPTLPAIAAQQDRGPTVRSAVGPIYPEAAWSLRMDNTIIAGIRVKVDGTVEDVHILHSQMPGFGFEEAAVDAVRQWRFDPARENGKKVSAFEVVRLEFQAPNGQRTIPNYEDLVSATLQDLASAHDSGMPNVQKWPICNGSGPCLAPIGLPWQMSWQLTRQRFLAWLLQHNPELRSDFVGRCSTVARVPYSNLEDTVGLNQGGFLYSSWERYQQGVSVIPPSVGGVGKTKVLEYPAELGTGVRKLRVRTVLSRRDAIRIVSTVERQLADPATRDLAIAFTGDRSPTAGMTATNRTLASTRRPTNSASLSSSRSTAYRPTTSSRRLSTTPTVRRSTPKRSTPRATRTTGRRGTTAKRTTTTSRTRKKQ